MSSGVSLLSAPVGRLGAGSSRTTSHTIRASSTTQNAPISSQAPSPIPLPYQPIIVLTCLVLGPCRTAPASAARPKIPARIDEDSTKNQSSCGWTGAGGVCRPCGGGEGPNPVDAVDHGCPQVSWG